MAESDITGLEARIRKLEEARRRERTAQRHASRALGAVSVASLLIVATFGLAIYLHARQEWTEDKLTASLQQEMEELNPTAMAEAQALGEHLLPIYAAESRKQLRQMAPEISRRLGRQMKLLSRELRADLHAKIASSEESIRQQTSQALFEAYPDLQDRAERERLTKSFRATTEDAVTRAVTDFDQEFSKDLQDLEQTILAFNKTESKDSTLELQKRFLHLWLELIDMEIMKL